MKKWQETLSEIFIQLIKFSEIHRRHLGWRRIRKRSNYSGKLQLSTKDPRKVTERSFWGIVGLIDRHKFGIRRW